jgi:aspartate ammonia-lyase
MLTPSENCYALLFDVAPMNSPLNAIMGSKEGVKAVKNQLQKRFGSIAVEKGFITAEQLFNVLQTQAKENVEQSEHRLIGQILLEKGYLSAEELDEILETMSNALIYSIGMGR